MDQMAHIKPVAPEKAYRLMNLGATCLVAAEKDGDADIMAAGWNDCLDLVPCKATVVIDKSHYTRRLMDETDYFAIQLPTAAIADVTMKLGSISKNDDPQKLEKSGAKLFKLPGTDIPMVEGCACWLLFRKLGEEAMAKTYDLFLGELVQAWADDRVFQDGHWLFETAPKDMAVLFYVAGGHFYRIGEPLDVKGYDHLD